MTITNYATSIRRHSFLDVYSQQPETYLVTLNITYQLQPYTGRVHVVLWRDSETIHASTFRNGPAIPLWFPFSLQGPQYYMTIVAPDLTGGVFTGRMISVTSAGTYNIELELSATEAPNTSIVGAISGVVTYNGDAVERDVLVYALDDPDRKLLAAVRSASNGAYSASWYEYIGRVLAVAVDDFGEPFQTNHGYALGDIVYPTTGIIGVVYECTQAGTSGTIEPTWWATIGQAGPSGTAQFTARAYARPLAHGPITPNVTITP